MPVTVSVTSSMLAAAVWLGVSVVSSAVWLGVSVVSVCVSAGFFDVSAQAITSKSAAKQTNSVLTFN